MTVERSRAPIPRLAATQWLMAHHLQGIQAVGLTSATSEGGTQGSPTLAFATLTHTLSLGLACMGQLPTFTVPHRERTPPFIDQVGTIDWTLHSVT
mmetsp:Transcript_74069/g.130724  ORF Transcript_74069/g.130724 Transcript_74069/m.130724 type:complete len:96 (-) Transcript_74069:1997-2284(-)